MFHHFLAEDGVGQDCLVCSTDFVYRNSRGNPEDARKGHPLASSSRQSRRAATSASHLKKSMPPLEFEYSDVVITENIQEVDAQSLENLPAALDNTNYRWADLDG